MQVITQTTKGWMRNTIVLWTMIATVAVLTGGYFMLYAQNARAASLTSVKDTLSTSAPGANANHTVTFTLSTALAIDGDDNILVEWDTVATADEFDFSGIVLGDVDISADGNDQTTAADCTGSEQVGVNINTTTDQITFTICTDATLTHWEAGDVIEVQVGTNAAGGTNQINNPSKSAAVGTADIHDIAITTNDGTSDVDTGSAQVAIIEGVTVSATIDESVAFSINNLASGSCTGDTGTPTVRDISGDADNTVNFNTGGATISANTFYVACQELSVSTNSSGGYVLTTETDTSLKSAGGDLIDSGNCDGTCTQSTGDTWATDTNNGFGYFCENGTGTDCATALDTTSEYVNFPCTGADADCDPRTGGESPVTVMSNTGQVSGNVAEIHYKLSVSGTQAAGDYETTVTYIATPTF